MQRFSLSVVVPTHNTRALTLRCLETLYQNPAGDDTEVIVVDDGSRDGTAAAIKERFPNAVVLVHRNALGFTAAVNTGLRRATGRILLLLNSDTEVQPGSLESLASAFVADPQLGIAGGNLQYPDGRPQWSGGSEPTLLWLLALASGLPAYLQSLPVYRSWRQRTRGQSDRVDWVTGACMGVRRDSWVQLGPLDEGYRFYAQDLDYCCRARALGWRVEIVDHCRIVHHHGATISLDRSDSIQGHQQLTWLWKDLLRWSRRFHSPYWAAAARRALRAGGWLRLVLLRLQKGDHQWERRTIHRALQSLLQP